jgi:hypothetical protein
MGLKKSEKRYHVTRQRLLPKFTAKRNPFGNSDEKPSQTAKTQTCECVDKCPEHPVPELVTAELQTKIPQKPGKVVSISESSNDARVSPPNSVPPSRPQPGWSFNAFAERLAGYSSQASKLLVWRRGQSPQGAIPRFNKALVQGELSLDRVKVVRNDLSDTDLEIIRPKPPVVTPLPSAGSEKAKPGLAESAASPLNLGLVPAGKT